ncbi:MAG: hypothetical protein QM703_22695 [Gemmatales bacterium]
MPQLEDVLREKTFKGQVENDGRRVFYTIMKDRKNEDAAKKTDTDWELNRTVHVLSYLIERLIEKKILTEKELDELLLPIA